MSLLKWMEEVVLNAELRHSKKKPPADTEAAPSAEAPDEDAPENEPELRLELVGA